MLQYGGLNIETIQVIPTRMSTHMNKSIREMYGCLWLWIAYLKALAAAKY